MTQPRQESTTIHGALLKIFDQGILLIGQSGVGKSECTLELLHRKHKLIADDSVLIKKCAHGNLFGLASPVLPYHMSLRGIGIIDVALIFGKDAVCDKTKIDLIIELCEQKSLADFDNLGIDSQHQSILGVATKSIQLPYSPQKSLATIIEVAVKNEILKKSGKNSATMFQKIHGQSLTKH